MCLSAGANLKTGTSRHLTEGLSSLRGTFFTNLKGHFFQTASLKSKKCSKLTGTKPAQVCHFFHVTMFCIPHRFMSVKFVR